MSLIHLNLRHYNTPGTHKGEGIVQASSNGGTTKDRLLNHQYHHRDRHGKRHTSEFTPGDSCSLNSYRGSDEHRCREQVDAIAGDNSPKRKRRGAREGLGFLWCPSVFIKEVVVWA